jgi:serine/threonine protein phosphatase PrpC
VIDHKLFVCRVTCKDDQIPVPINTTSSCIQNVAIISRTGFAVYNPIKKNQDSYFHIDDPNTNTFILAVLDGHGEYGHLVANYISSEMEHLLTTNPHYLTDLEKALAETVEYTETLLLQKYRPYCGFSGTTLCLAAFRNSTLIVTNIGDSRLVIGNNHREALYASRDHKASEADERCRIESTGGRVIIKTYEDGYVGPARVYLKDDDLPGLAMSRSIADTVVADVGVISTPEITTRALTPDQKVLIVATDGLWDFMSNDDAVTIALASANPSEAVSTLMDQCLVKWQQNSPNVVDDMTIGVIFL